MKMSKAATILAQLGEVRESYVYNIKSKDELKKLGKVEHGADIFIGKYIIHVKFRDKGKSYLVASLLSSIENLNTGKLLDATQFPVFIDNFLHLVKEKE